MAAVVKILPYYNYFKKDHKLRNWMLNFYGLTTLHKEMDDHYITKFNNKIKANKMASDLQIKSYITDHLKMLKLYNNIILYANSLIDQRQTDHAALMQKITSQKLKKIKEVKNGKN